MVLTRFELAFALCSGPKPDVLDLSTTAPILLFLFLDYLAANEIHEEFYLGNF